MSALTWLPIAIVAFLLAAVTATVDRAIVHKEQTKPIVISFWVSLFSIATAALVLIGFLPFGFAENFKFEFGPSNIMVLAMLSGFLGQIGILKMYRALRYGEVTRVLSVMGGLAPIVSFVAAYIFLSERLGGLALLSFVLLILATVILTLNPKKRSQKARHKWVLSIILASIVFGIQAVLAKYVYDNYHFISAYSVSGLGAGIYVLAIALLSKNVRQELAGIFDNKSKTKKKTTRSKQVYLIFGNSMIGGVSVILTNLAISMGSPTLVGALRGVQYAGIFVIALVLAKIYPKVLDEDFSKKAIIIKSIGIMLTISGITLLAI